MIFSYSRVSTIEQGKAGTTSLPEQERRNKLVAQMRGAGTFDFVAYVDNGVSGSIPLRERPAGGEMLSAVASGDVIIAMKLDRLFRSALDALQTAEEMKQQGVDIILTDLGTDPVGSNGAAKFFFGILAQVADFERERIAERTNDGKSAKAAKFDGTGYAGGSVPRGYKVVGQGTEARLIRDDNEQKILDVVASLAKRFESPWPICKELNRLGFRDRAGNFFRVPQIQRMLVKVQHA